MTASEYKCQNPILRFLEARGAVFSGSGAQRATNMCPSLQHKPGHKCVTVDTTRDLWHCNDCGTGGDIITWLTIEQGKSTGQVLKDLNLGSTVTWKPIPKPSSTPPDPAAVRPVIEKTYSYRNERGDEVFQAVRFKPKNFSQRQPNGKGGWVWSMEGVHRVLYRLPEVLQSQTVCLCEGEKDADTLTALGFCGTCNVGGAGKWMDGYTESLIGKEVLIFGDNDDAGRDHVELVFNSIAGKAKWVKIIKIPSAFKDVTEYVESFTEQKEAVAVINEMIASAHAFYQGVVMPIYTMAELEARYVNYTKEIECESLNLGKWLPSFNRLRKIMPGEVVLIIGDTGAGKTALLQSLALSSIPLPTILFEIELPAELLFERFLAAKNKISARDIESAYSKGDNAGQDALKYHFRNLFVCDESNLSVENLESIILRSELKMGTKPKLVLLDYIQLLRGSGSDRYDRASNAAESIKRIARTTKTIIVMASQRSRPGKDGKPEISLYDGKESGALENSSGVVIGAWRDKADNDLLNLKVLKSTKGGSGLTLACNFDGEKMIITERSRV